MLLIVHLLQKKKLIPKGKQCVLLFLLLGRANKRALHSGRELGETNCPGNNQDYVQ